MRRISIIVFTIILLTLTINPFSKSESTQNPPGEIKLDNLIVTNIEKEHNSEEVVDPDYLKVAEITGWDIELATYFVTECRWRGVSVFEEALPISFVESSYRFDAINHNSNGTSDFGLFQINQINHKFLVDKLKEEQYMFDDWNFLDPHLNIAAGVYYISYIKDKYNISDNTKLYSVYNRGYAGAKQYASRNGTYVTSYSQKVNAVKKELIKY